MDLRSTRERDDSLLNELRCEMSVYPIPQQIDPDVHAWRWAERTGQAVVEVPTSNSGASLVQHRSLYR
jgi:hypothetical protein